MKIDLTESQISALRVGCLVMAKNLESLVSQTKDRKLIGIYSKQMETYNFLADLLQKERMEWWSGDFD